MLGTTVPGKRPSCPGEQQRERTSEIYSPSFPEGCTSGCPRGYPHSPLAPLSVGVIPPVGSQRKYDSEKPQKKEISYPEGRETNFGKILLKGRWAT